MLRYKPAHPATHPHPNTCCSVTPMVSILKEEALKHVECQKDGLKASRGSALWALPCCWQRCLLSLLGLCNCGGCGAGTACMLIKRLRPL